MGRGNDYRDNKRGRDGYAPDPWAQDRQPSFGERRSSSSFEDRQSRPRSGPALSSGPETQARVKWFNAEKGFGFVAADDGGKDLFVHRSALERSGARDLPEGMRVRVKIVEGQKGPEVAEIEPE